MLNIFYNCTSLASVTFLENLTSIKNYAFYGCSSLSSINIPMGVTSIDDYAFQQCSNLQLVRSNILSPAPIGTGAFAAVDSRCVLEVPLGTITAYQNAGWTKSVFGGGVVEFGDVEENFCIENAVTADYMQNVTYPDDDYSYSKITDYLGQETTYRKDHPRPVRIEGPGITNGEALVLEIYADDSLVRSDTFDIAAQIMEVWNLVPQTRYTYRLYAMNADGSKSKVGRGNFDTTGQVRMMKIDGMGNFRDIGGWAVQGGKRVKYDKIFRSNELSMPTAGLDITPAGIKELLDVQGIQVEIDFGDIYEHSPIENSVEFVSGGDYQIRPYVEGLKNTKMQYKNCFEKVVSCLKAGKKVLFHCNFGADRTGTFAFMLEGLLGVSESDLSKEYELACFNYATQSNNRSNSNYKGLVDYIKNTFPAKSINESIELMALDFGITQQDIEDFRNLMTEAGSNTVSSQDIVIGDVDGDGEISIIDVTKVIELYLKADSIGE